LGQLVVYCMVFICLQPNWVEFVVLQAWLFIW